RLEAGEPLEVIIDEFQAAISGTDTDRGYVCLIDQRSALYLGHPDLDALGMQAKPEALFDEGFDGEQLVRWQDPLMEGASAGGLLIYGEDMPTEVIYFNAVPGTEWTVSSHENAARIDAEIAVLRTRLILGAVALALLLALPASLAGRVVARRHERQVARQNELERHLLEAENARKSEELERARQLQLSMLPDRVPEHPRLTLAAHMQTATEVGGDYYDFDYDSKGTGALTLAIGDATGHGMTAGTMVTATKSLWHAFAREPDLATILRESNAALRQMHLSKLFMAFALARIDGHTLTLAGAGMPPALLYRAATGTVEPLPLKGLPLGSPATPPYPVTEVPLGVGDTLLLMSDGFPELFDADHAMLGYDRAIEVFTEVADQSPNAILAHLRAAVDAWTGGGPPDDDITFVVATVTA
ncbi:MAG: PP2C family protein-serine/threonine phosphatase, partial [Bacteroidota bacterium]